MPDSLNIPINTDGDEYTPHLHAYYLPSDTALISIHRRNGWMGAQVPREEVEKLVAYLTACLKARRHVDLTQRTDD